ncbi:MAG: hypothetical protein RL338_996 [Chloroflexota bacterium]|jgi:PII-like signaling protein
MGDAAGRGEALRLRVYVGEADTWHGRPLYQALVEFLRERGVAGATVLRGIEGFGASSRIHTTRLLRLSEDLPIVVEAVDDPGVIRPLLDELGSMVAGGLVTLEPVEVVLRRAKPPRA